MVRADSALPGRLRVLFSTVPHDAVPVSDVGAGLHGGAIHRRLLSVPQGETVQDRKSTSCRSGHGGLLHPARRYTGNRRLLKSKSEVLPELYMGPLGSVDLRLISSQPDTS